MDTNQQDLASCVRRIIQKLVREPLADCLLEKNPGAGAKVKVDVGGKRLSMAEG